MPTFRIATYNIRYGGHRREDLIRGVLESIRPDLVVFTEVTSDESFSAIAASVGEHSVLAPCRIGRTRVAVASRWPILESAFHGPPWSSRRWLEATLCPHGVRPVRVHAVHLTAQPLWPFEFWRRREVGHLVRRLSVKSGIPQIVAGDFNALAPGDSQRRSGAPWWVRAQWFLNAGTVPRLAIRELSETGYVDCYRSCNATDSGFTVPARNPSARVDYVFASPELKSSLRAAGTHHGRSRNVEASDHLPIWADFEWPGPGQVAHETG